MEQDHGGAGSGSRTFPNLSSVELSRNIEASSASTPQDGCVVLGKADSSQRNTYTTHYVINHKRQREDLCGEVMKGAFCPCVLDENRHSLTKILWAIMSSETFLFTLDVTVLALGVAKEATDLRDVDEYLHFVHSLIESLLTILTILIRAVSVHSKFKAVTNHVISCEHMEKPSTRKIQGNTLKKWLYRFYFLGVFLVLVVVTCFLLFYHFAHLGWTILTNNFCLEVIALCSNLLLERLDSVTNRIRQDQHKAVIYEALLLLQEAHSSTETKEQKTQFCEKVHRFSKAIVDSDLFGKPEHIEVSEWMRPHWDAITTIEMQTFF